jgi:hypothetical protein
MKFLVANSKSAMEMHLFKIKFDNDFNYMKKTDMEIIPKPGSKYGQFSEPKPGSKYG